MMMMMMMKLRKACLRFVQGINLIFWLIIAFFVVSGLLAANRELIIAWMTTSFI